MSKNEIEIYRRPESMEPLMPTAGEVPLGELSREVWLRAGALSGHIPAEATRLGVAKLVRHMNSYYSNLIEGHKTLPRDIDKALNKNFSESDKDRNNQIMHLAHIEVDAMMRAKMAREQWNPCSQAFLCWLHKEFYARLPEEFRWSKTKSGKEYPIVPGQFRDFNVDVWHHTPPHHDDLPLFLGRFERFYSSKDILPTQALVAAAAAHHRFTWIHPFGDGNGRVARLFSHALMIQNRIDADGLWTLSRGFARYLKDYYAALENADRARLDDYDGRGNLSDKSLYEFCRFFLATAIDQIKFMSELLQLNDLEERIREYVFKRCPVFKIHKDQAARLLIAALREGEIRRGAAAQITGRKATVARDILKRALASRLLESDSPKGHLVRLAFPSETWDYYFPRLCLDLPSQTTTA